MGEQEGEHLSLDFRPRLEVTLSLQPTVTSTEPGGRVPQNCSLTRLARTLEQT